MKAVIKSLMWFIVYVVFGMYLINSALVFYVLPEFVLQVDKWIILIGGVLVLWGGVNHYRFKKSKV